MARSTSNTPHQICLVFSLRSGAEEEYDRRHRTVWPELLEQIRAAGITQNAVLRTGTSVIVFVAHPDDVVAALARVGASQPARRWNEWFADLMATEPSEAIEVWRMDPADGRSG